MELLRDAFTFGTMGLLSYAAVVFLRDLRGATVGRIAVAFVLCVIAYLLCARFDLSGTLGLLAAAPILFGCISGPVVLWLLAQAVFDDDFRVRPWHWAVLAAVAGLFFLRHGLRAAGVDAPHRLLEQSQMAIAIVLLALSMAVALGGRQTDLLEWRRRFRVYYVLAICLFTLGRLVVEATVGERPVDPALHVLDTGLVFALTLAGLLWLTAARPEPLLAAEDGAARTPPPAPGGAPMHPAEQAIIDRLQDLIARESVHHEEGLTVGRLAERLEVPEYRLRRAINRRLGHRNFNAFLNHYRIRDAKAALADPALAGRPIANIAMDFGYRSLAPFNRAFREIVGTTPTEFRRHGAPAADPAGSLGSDPKLYLED